MVSNEPHLWRILGQMLILPARRFITRARLQIAAIVYELGHMEFVAPLMA